MNAEDLKLAASLSRLFTGHISLEDLETLLHARGYRIEKHAEGAEQVVRIFRPDGTQAIEAKRPLPN